MWLADLFVVYFRMLGAVLLALAAGWGFAAMWFYKRLSANRFWMGAGLGVAALLFLLLGWWGFALVFAQVGE